MKLPKSFLRDFFWIYFWLFQAIIIYSFSVNEYLLVLVVLLFSTNIVIAFIDIQTRIDKLRKLHLQNWENVTDHFEKAESFEKWQLFLSEVRSKLKYANPAISVYAYLFYIFNGYLFIVYYLPILYLFNPSETSRQFLFNFNLPEIDRQYLLLIFLFFYSYEVFLDLYLKKVFISINEKAD